MRRPPALNLSGSPAALKRPPQFPIFSGQHLNASVSDSPSSTPVRLTKSPSPASFRLSSQFPSLRLPSIVCLSSNVFWWWVRRCSIRWFRGGFEGTRSGGSVVGSKVLDSVVPWWVRAFSKLAKEDDPNLETVIEAIGCIPEKHRTFLNHTCSEAIPANIDLQMASPAKSGTTRTGKSSKMSFDSLMRNRIKIKTESSAALPPKSKRKALVILDSDSPKRTMLAPSNDPKAIVVASDATPLQKAPIDFDVASTVVIDYLRQSKSRVDESLVKMVEAEKRASDLNVGLTVAEEKVTRLSKELATKSDALVKVEVELSDVRKQYADLQATQVEMSKTHAEMAMDLATYFGQRARFELFEAYFAGKHQDWDLEQAKDILDKDFPEGCPHAEWLEGAGVVNPEGDVESSGRNDDADAAKGDPQEASVTKPSKNAEGGDA